MRVVGVPNVVEPVVGSPVPPAFHSFGDGNIIGQSRLLIFVGILDISFIVTPETVRAAIAAEIVADDKAIIGPSPCRALVSVSR